MDRGRLQGVHGDALHCLSCAAGYNLRWLIRTAVRLSIGVVFLGSVAFVTDERNYGGDDCQPIKLDGFVLQKLVDKIEVLLSGTRIGKYLICAGRRVAHLLGALMR